jgi:hypothetical protein
MTFANANFGVQQGFGVGTTYTLFPGNTVSFQTEGISFTGGNFIIPDAQTIQVSQISGLTFESTGTTGVSGMTGTITYPNWTNLTGITVSDPASVDVLGNFSVAGDVFMESGGTFSFTNPSGATLAFTMFFTGSGSINDTPFSTTFEITPGVVMVSSVAFGANMSGQNFTGSGTATIPPGSTLGVGERVFINQGATASGPTGASYGGGGAIGGGAPALVTGIGITYSSTNMPAGGGGGSYGGSLASIRQVPGDRENAFRNRYYPDNILVGDGGSGATAAGVEYLVIQQKLDSGVIPPALTVNGDLSVSDNISCNKQIIFGPATGPSGSAYLSQNAGVNIMTNVNGIAALIVGATASVFYPGGAQVSIDAGSGKLSAMSVDSVGTVTGSDITASSDVRLKTNIETVDSALERLMKMRGVFFERTTEPGERRVGVIAQEIEEILPEVVHTDSDGMKSVSYGSIVGLLIEAIKEQQEIIKRLQT